jgi:hypothetical protein
MAPYKYQALDPIHDEIRVLHLLPGALNDPIRLSIEHTPFKSSLADEPWLAFDEDLRIAQEALPSNWKAHRTLEGRPIYSCWAEDELAYTTWEPPISTMEELGCYQTPISQREVFKAAFEAVSYTWGFVNPASSINVDIVQSQAPDATTTIGSNLLELLRRLRKSTESRTLWVDAICINQTDDKEKSEQIPKMQAIFALAKRVVIWLGESTAESTMALEALQHIGSQLEYTFDDWFLPAPNRKEKNWWNAGIPIPLSTPTWVAISHLMQRPYWERVWTVQEAQAANEDSVVHC